jgi:hypothetical protein
LFPFINTQNFLASVFQGRMKEGCDVRATLLNSRFNEENASILTSIPGNGAVTSVSTEADRRLDRRYNALLA